MKYVPPYGISDPDAPYINGDPSQARQGSIPPAAAFEHPQRELVNVVTDSFLVPSDTDLEQVAKGIRSQRMNFVDDTGSINNLSVAFDPPLGGYSIGFPLRVKILNTNTGPSTIDAGAGRVPIRKPTGAEMAAGDLPGGGLAELVYDGTVFQMINFGGAGGTGGGGNVFLTNIPYTVDTSPTANTVIANFSPAITALTVGLIFMVKIANTNNTIANINVNGLGNKPIKAQGGHPSWPLLAGDIMVNDVIVFIYDGTAFWIYPNNAINQKVTYNVANMTDFNSLFVALGRKRISTQGSVTIQMAAGRTYNAPLTTYHADADRITVQGTMSGSAPVSANFQQHGNSPAQRAQDSSLNIQMLRGRYLTEIKFTNSFTTNIFGQTTSYAVEHVGPGFLTFKNLLITGANTPSGNNQMVGIGVRNFSSVNCVGVTVWGSGDYGLIANAGYMNCDNCHASGCMYNGFDCAAQAGLSITRGGAYGCGGSGVLVSANGMVWASPDVIDPGVGPYFTCNASYGVASEQATVSLNYVTTIANDLDVYAFDMGVITNYASLAYTWSPEINTVGNLNSIYRVY